MTYHIMHDNKIVAQIDTQGYCHIFSKKFMPYNLYLDETDNGPLNNLSTFGVPVEFYQQTDSTKMSF